MASRTLLAACLVLAGLSSTGAFAVDALSHDMQRDAQALSELWQRRFDQAREEQFARQRQLEIEEARRQEWLAGQAKQNGPVAQGVGPGGRNVGGAAGRAPRFNRDQLAAVRRHQRQRQNAAGATALPDPRRQAIAAKSVRARYAALAIGNARAAANDAALKRHFAAMLRASGW